MTHVGDKCPGTSFLSPMWGTIYIKVNSLAIMSLISFSVSVLLLSKFTGLQRKVHTSYRPYLIIAHQLLMILVFRTYYPPQPPTPSMYRLAISSEIALFKFRLGWFVYWEASRPP